MTWDSPTKYWLTIDRLDGERAEFVHLFADGQPGSETRLTIARGDWQDAGRPDVVTITVDPREVQS